MLSALTARLGMGASRTSFYASQFMRSSYPSQTIFDQFTRQFSKKAKDTTSAIIPADQLSKLPNIAKVKLTEVTTQKFKKDSFEVTTRTTESIAFHKPVKPANIAKKPIRQWNLEEIFNKRQIAFYEDMQLRCLEQPAVKLTAEETASLVAKNYGTGAAKKGKVLHLVIGPPGSGKSSVVVNPLRDKYGAMVIDSDFIKPQIQGYNNGLGGNAVHAPSAEIASQLLVKAMENGDNIIHPTTGYCEQYILELIKAASKKGYKVGLHLVDLPSRIAAKRVLKRAEAEIDGVRQIVNLHYTLNVVGTRPRKVFRHIVKHHPEKIHAYTHHSNNVKHGEKAKLVKKSETEIPDTHTEPNKPTEDS